MTDYYVDVAVGDDGNLGTSPGAGNAWASFEKAADTVAAGDTVYVKASGVYSAQDGANGCICLIDTLGTNIAPIVWRAYFATIDDGGIVKMDASVNALVNVIKTDMAGGSVFNVFEGFEITGATSHGVVGGIGNDDHIKVYRCKVTNNGGNGVRAGANSKIAQSIVSANTGNGIYIGSDSYVVDSIVYGNLNAGIYCVSRGNISNVILYDNTVYQGRFANVANIYNTIFDGDGAADGVRLDLSEGSIIQNSIIYDCVNGIVETADTGANASAFNNLFYSNTTDAVNFLPVADQPGSFVATSDPFVDAAGRDYRLSASSEAINKGIDAGYTIDFWEQYDGGTNPPVMG